MGKYTVYTKGKTPEQILEQVNNLLEGKQVEAFEMFENLEFTQGKERKYWYFWYKCKTCGEIGFKYIGHLTAHLKNGGECEFCNNCKCKCEQDIRNTNQYRRAKEIARQRDENACFVTGIQRKGNEMHHIFPVVAYPELACNPNNLVTLTKEEHIEYHKFTGGTIHAEENCNWESFKAFLQQKNVASERIQKLERQLEPVLQCRMMIA